MATLYAKAVGGNWSAAGTWSNVSSAGGDSSGPPTAADDVIFETGSGNVTIDVNSVCRSVDCTAGTGDYGGILTHNDSTLLNVGDGTAGAGNVAFKFSTGMTYTLGTNKSAQLLLRSTSATQQAVDCKGKTMSNIVTFGSGNTTGNYQLTGALNMGTGGTVTHNQGTLDTNGQTCSWGLFNSNNSNTRSLTLGNSNITITGTGTSWTTATTTGLTLNAGGSTITLTGSTGAFAGGVATYNNIVYAPTVVQTMSLGSTNAGTTTCANFTFTSSIAAKTEVLNILSNLTVTNTLTLAGNSTTNRLLVQSSTVGTSRTLTAAAISLTNLDFIDTTGAGLPGNAAWTGTSLGDGQGNSNITFDTPATQTRSGAGGSWSTAGNWTSRVPLPQDNVIINGSASGTITADMPRWGKDINFTGFTGTISFTIGANIFGNLIATNNFSISGNFSSNFRGRGAQTITSGGKRFPEAWNFLAPGGSYTLQDNYSIDTGASGGITLSNGTFDANGFNVRCGSFTSTTTDTRTLNMGTGKWMITGNGTIWNVATSGITVSAALASIYVSDVSATSKTLSLGTAIYGNIYIAGGGTGAVIFFDSSPTIANIFIQGGPKTLQFKSGQTKTITGSIVTLGTPANPITVNAVTGGSAATVALGTSGTWSSSYNSITDITVTGTRTPVLAYHGTLSNTSGITSSTIRPSAINHTSATTRSASATRTLSSTRTGAN